MGGVDGLKIASSIDGKFEFVCLLIIASSVLLIMSSSDLIKLGNKSIQLDSSAALLVNYWLIYNKDTHEQLTVC